MRQDPPFDLNYIGATHLLERVHPDTLVINDPVAVRNAPEKLFVTQFPDLMPPTLITFDPDQIKAFRARSTRRSSSSRSTAMAVLGCFTFRPDDDNLNSLLDLSGAGDPGAAGGAALPARDQGGRQANRVDRRRAGRGRQSHSAGGRCARQPPCRWPGRANAAHPTRSGDLRGTRAGAAGAGAPLRRDRRDRWLADRDQRHLADGSAGDQSPR